MTTGHCCPGQRSWRSRDHVEKPHETFSSLCQEMLSLLSRQCLFPGNSRNPLSPITSSSSSWERTLTSTVCVSDWPSGLAVTLRDIAPPTPTPLLSCAHTHTHTSLGAGHGRGQAAPPSGLTTATHVSPPSHQRYVAIYARTSGAPHTHSLAHRSPTNELARSHARSSHDRSGSTSDSPEERSLSCLGVHSSSSTVRRASPAHKEIL